MQYLVYTTMRKAITSGWRKDLPLRRKYISSRKKRSLKGQTPDNALSESVKVGKKCVLDCW
jgi:hypothetical protein